MEFADENRARIRRSRGSLGVVQVRERVNAPNAGSKAGGDRRGRAEDVEDDDRFVREGFGPKQRGEQNGFNGQLLIHGVGI